MTKREFYQELRKYKGQFEVLPTDRIRCKRLPKDRVEGYCPIAFIYSKKKKKRTANGLVWTDGIKLGLSEQAVNDIVNAADAAYSGDRKSLLRAVGL
mgnify:CR=1 FL=1